MSWQVRSRCTWSRIRSRTLSWTLLFDESALVLTPVLAALQEENVLLRQKMEALEARMRKDSYYHQRLAEEVARYRTERGLPSELNVDEERRLQKKLEVCHCTLSADDPSFAFCPSCSQMTLM